MSVSLEERRALRALVWIAMAAGILAMALPDTPGARTLAVLPQKDSVGADEDVILWDRRSDSTRMPKDSVPAIPHIVGRGCFQ